MSKTTKHVLGNQRGQIGEIVGRVVNGVQLYSAHNGTIKDARTPKQLSHRARFAAITTLGMRLNGPISVGFRNLAASQPLISPFNIFVKTNMPFATYDSETHTASVDFAHVVISHGNTPFVGFTGVSFTEALKATASFTPYDDTPGADASDSVYLIVYLPELGMSITAIALRSSGTVTATLPAVCGGKTAHVWGFVRTAVEEPLFVDAYGTSLHPNECSLSSYIGTGTVLSA